MTYTQFQRLVAKHKGWIESGVAYFPTVHARRLFEAALNDAGNDPH